VAHDLRNPLTVIEGWAGALTDAFESRGQVSAESGVGMTRRIESAAGRMREFIRELLDFTLARDQSLRPADVAVGDVAEEVVALLEARSWPGGRPDLRVDAPGTAYADRGLVRIVVDNLVTNACKYVAPGTRPRVVISTCELDGDWLEVAVADNGIGVPADERSLVFESFHRVPQEGYAGTGLGLAICRRIVERHGGAIRVEDEPTTGGSRFLFTLPRTAAVLEQHAPAATSIG
jgi:signal transduction histidine kinase